MKLNYLKLRVYLNDIVKRNYNYVGKKCLLLWYLSYKTLNLNFRAFIITHGQFIYGYFTIYEF